MVPPDSMPGSPALLLRGVTVRPTDSLEESRHWDALMAEHHYLPYHRLFGRALRHVAEHDGVWLVLIGWQVWAFKLGLATVGSAGGPPSSSDACT